MAINVYNAKDDYKLILSLIIYDGRFFVSSNIFPIYNPKSPRLVKSSPATKNILTIVLVQPG